MSIKSGASKANIYTCIYLAIKYYINTIIIIIILRREKNGKEPIKLLKKEILAKC